MRNISLLSLLLILSLVCVSSALDLARTPVQDAMRVELLAGKDDDFKDDSDRKARPDNNQEFASEGRKSVMRAGLYSLLLPGLGEWYAGHHQKARFFFAGEAVTWISFTSFRVYGHARQQDYINFAATNANAHLEDKDNTFRDLVGFYTDIDQYNTFGRVYDPERPYLQDTPENHWRWESEKDQGIYRHLKNRSREAYRRSDFMIGVAVVTRVISVIDAIRDAKHANSQLERDLSDASPLQLEINPLSSTRQVALTFRTPF